MPRLVFQDRVQAGKVLAQRLENEYANKNAIVLALPRGGVPVAYQIAEKLMAPLDVYLVRKIGVPYHEELAMGAITQDTQVFNEDIIKMLRISEQAVQQVIEKETTELNRRNQKYRGGAPPIDVSNKTVILVDDGIATGATVKAAYRSLKKKNPSKIVVAVPVGAADTCKEMRKEVEVLSLMEPENLGGVGAWYMKFDQTEDEEVMNLLGKNNKMMEQRQAELKRNLDDSD